MLCKSHSHSVQLFENEGSTFLFKNNSTSSFLCIAVHGSLLITVHSLCTADVAQHLSLASDNNNNHFAQKNMGGPSSHINFQTLSGSEKEENEIN